MATTSTDPFAAMGGGVKLPSGGWVPRNHPDAIAYLASTGAGGASTPLATGTATAPGPDPYNPGGTLTPSVAGAGGTTPGITASGALLSVPAAAPAYTPPTRSAPTAAKPVLGTLSPYTGPGTFTFDPAEISLNPSYTTRFKEGLRGVDASLAARGIAGGDTLMALTRYGQAQAAKEMEAAYARAADTYRTRRTAAGEDWDRDRLERDAAYAAAVGDWSRDYDERGAAFDAASRGAEAAYRPVYDTWAAREAARASDARANFDRAWEIDQFTRNDDYRRWATALDDATKSRSISLDDAFRYRQLDQQNKQFLASLGL